MYVDAAKLIVPLLAGLVLGALYSAALWWTVGRLAQARRPVLLTVVSFYVRLAALTAGFYVIMDGRLLRLLIALLGFLVMRYFIVRKVRPPEKELQQHMREDRLWK